MIDGTNHFVRLISSRSSNLTVFPIRPTSRNRSFRLIKGVRRTHQLIRRRSIHVLNRNRNGPNPLPLTTKWLLSKAINRFNRVHFNRNPISSIDVFPNRPKGNIFLIQHPTMASRFPRNRTTENAKVLQRGDRKQDRTTTILFISKCTIRRSLPFREQLGPTGHLRRHQLTTTVNPSRNHSLPNQSTRHRVTSSSIIIVTNMRVSYFRFRE